MFCGGAEWERKVPFFILSLNIYFCRVAKCNVCLLYLCAFPGWKHFFCTHFFNTTCFPVSMYCGLIFTYIWRNMYIDASSMYLIQFLFPLKIGLNLCWIGVAFCPKKRVSTLQSESTYPSLTWITSCIVNSSSCK